MPSNLACILVCLAWSICAPSAHAANRIVSLNVCTDSLLLELVDPSRIASLSYLSRDPEYSFFYGKAANIPINHGLAEEVVPLQPDLVLAGEYTTRPTTRLLEKLRIRVERIAIANDFDGLRANLKRVGQLTDTHARAELLISRFDAALVSPPTEARPVRALMFRARGFSVDQDSLIHHVMAAAGLHNLALDYPRARTGQISLEQLLLARPQLIIFPPRVPNYPSLAHELLHHRALRHLVQGSGATAQAVEVPSRLWTCAGTYVAHAIARLRRAAEGIRSE